MYEGNMKEVYFDVYCASCVHKDTKEADCPCYDCLAVPARPNSHKPEKYEDKHK